MFAVGQQPTATQDPLGLRRTALGLVRLLAEGQATTGDRQPTMDDHDGPGVGRQGSAISLTALIQAAAAVQPIPVDEVTQTAVGDFILGRLEQWLRDQGYRHDLTQAVLAAQRDNPAGAVETLKALSVWAARPDWLDLLTAYARCVRIVRSHAETFDLDPARFQSDAERRLYDALQDAQARLNGARSLDRVFGEMQALIAPINQFFDAVMVEVDDAALRNNRRALVQRIARLPMDLVDLSKVEEF
jgi:glycyl-tRNA synthetase beta subunit